MNLKIWTWSHNSKVRKTNESNAQYLAFVEAITEALRHTHIALNSNVHVTHAQRPPAPRPIQITVSYVMMDGSCYKTFILLNGQTQWRESIPGYIAEHIREVTHIEYFLSYSDGGLL